MDITGEMQMWIDELLKPGDIIWRGPTGIPLKDTLGRAINEIERLRSLAGAVSPGPTAAEVLTPLRHKAPDADDVREMLRNRAGG